jgi:hypothetical protein
MLTGGQVADCTAGEQLLEQMPQASMLHGDKGYDSNAIRRQVEGKGAMPNIPPKTNRRWKNCFSPTPSIATATPSSAVRTSQGLPAHRYSIRQAGRQLPRRRMPRGYRQLLVMSPDPRVWP